MAVKIRASSDLWETQQWVSGWSQHRLCPTFDPREERGLIFRNPDHWQRWQAARPSNDWDGLTLTVVEWTDTGRDRGGDRFRRLNRNPNR